MSLHKVIAPAAALLISHGAAAQGEWRCDCTSVVESCNAEVTIRGSWVEITSDHQQCSRVDYFIDGLPFVAVVVEGADRQDWIARTNDPRVMVQSCQVCRDNANAAAPAPRPAAAQPETGGDTSLRPLIEVQPAYPSTALARRVEGYVEVELTVNPAGDVANARVVAADPANVFDQAALAAVNRWRYPPDPAREPQTVRERLEFDVDNAGPAAQPAAPSAPVPAPTVGGGPRNQCVRENAVYNFGDMVEIGLMNACDEPLLVFGCAPGTGRNLGRWVCVDSESQGSVLVPPSDGRVGAQTTLATVTGSRSLTYADSFVVTRAPNTQYWWVACPTGDSDCRAGARQWTRAVDRQLATIDPEDRSSIAVARSY
jgi:TonB family protein